MDSTPSPRQPTWEHFALFYTVCAVLFSIFATLIREPSQIASLLLAIFFSALLLSAVFGIGLAVLHAKTDKLGKSITAFLQEAWHFVALWGALGVANIAGGELARDHLNPVGALLFGPFAWSLGGAQQVWVVTFSALFSMLVTGLYFRHFLTREAESVGAAWIHRLRDAVPESMRGVPTAAKRGERVEREEPEGATFVETDDRIADWVIPRAELPNRIPMGVAELAPKRGKRKREIDVGLPIEGSGMIVGPPGSGKSLLLQRILLNAALWANVRFVVTSTKPRDLAGPTVRYLREIGLNPLMFDVSRTVKGDRSVGDPVYWSPVFAATRIDEAQRVAANLVNAGHETDSRIREDFWNQMSNQIIAPCLYAAYLEGRSYEWALTNTLAWDNPEFTEVDEILFARLKGEEATRVQRAYGDWVKARKFMLEQVASASGPKWRVPQGLDSARATGMSIGGTLSNIGLEIAKEAAFEATNPPAEEGARPLSPRDWIRSDDPSVLFLVGNQRYEGVSRSIFAPLLNDILVEAQDYANEMPDGRLPYRLVILGDEIANLAPVSGLPKIAATSRSIGVQMLLVFQAYSQLEAVYGRENATTLAESLTTKLVLSGVSDDDLVHRLQTLAGTAYVTRKPAGKKDSGGPEATPAAEPLINGHTLASLRRPNATTGEAGEGLLFTSGGVTKVKVPFWALREPYASRGDLPPRLRERFNAIRARKGKRARA